MTGFVSQPTTLPTKISDPTKHVNYTLGMILGVDDLTQEFAYLSGRDQWLARDLIGYGTVCGLKVSIEDGGEPGPRVLVESGAALSPRGQLIRVRPAQCAHLNAWLQDRASELVGHTGSPPSESLTLYVGLCYRECPADLAPIPGEPCRDDAEIWQPSRFQDDFKLELRLTPPDQREEDAVRQFVAWLRQVEVSEGAGPFTSLPDFKEAVRHAIEPAGSPPTSPPAFTIGSPPDTLRIPAAEVCDYLRVAFRVWVTELRPLIQSCGVPPEEHCLLLAQLAVPLVRELDGALKVTSAADILINEDQRPYVIHLRLLQEWLICGPLLTSTLAVSSPPGPGPNPTSAFEADLTRIVALSWSHGGNTTLDFTLDGNPQKGLIVAFGKATLDDGGLARVESGSLDHETFQIFVELSGTEASVDFWTYRRIRPDSIVPVRATTLANNLVTEAQSVAGPAAGAVALLLSEDAFDYLQNKKLMIMLKGDFVLDETGQRVIDAEYLRTALPTGDRPREAKVGTQGGRFESWVRVGLIINVNTATAAELQTLPRIGPTLAQNIVDSRTADGDFRVIDDLLRVPGIGESTLNYLRPFITV